MPQIAFKSTGVEELLDEVETLLMRDLNDSLAYVYEQRELMDRARALRRGVAYEPIEYSEVPVSHYHVGNFPSMVLAEVPKEDYPYVVLTVEDWAPDAEDPRNDHMNVYRDQLSVHCLASATPAEGGEVVYRRALRMGEAVFLSLGSDPRMQKRLSGFSNPVRGQHSVPWTAQEKGRGDDYWFQSVGQSYAVKSFTSMYQ
jgi:hypothetical protein